MPTTPSILIVEDNIATAEMLTAHLNQHGFEVYNTENGDQAMEVACRKSPDLILLDIMLEGMDGFTTCRCLKKESLTCDIPVIFMTVLTSTVDKVKGFGAGGADYITKPFEWNEVICRIVSVN